jgi:hypothetical protein
MNIPSAAREPMLLLVIALPAAAVVAGFATLVLAMSGPGDAGDARVRRVAQTQTTDLAPDLAAARLALRGDVRADDNGAVTLHFEADAPDEPVLQLVLRHAAVPDRDRHARLVRAGEGLYLGRLDAARAPGAYNVELAPESYGWRLVGRIEPGSSALTLGPALGD